MIKPEFFDDPTIGDLSFGARLLFIGLWLQADKEGRLKDDVRRLKVRIFPYDDVDVAGLLNELTTSALVCRYVVDGQSCLWIRTFTHHQRPHPKEPDSALPACPALTVEKNGGPWKNNADLPESGVRNLDSGVRNLDSGNQKKSGGGSKRPIYTSDRFAVFEWQLDELGRVLGPHTAGFDLHGFFDDLTQKSRSDGLVIPKSDVWNWLQSQVMAEAKRRGLPMAQATPSAPTNKRIAGLVAGGEAFLNRNRS